MFNSFGHVFVVTTFGESHGPALGAVIDGCPARLALCEADVQRQLDRRRPGQGPLSTERTEADQVEILSGLSEGLTLGSPIALLVRNADQRPTDYASLAGIPRPSHADFTYKTKYGILAPSGGGRASARETVARVAAGAVAEKLLRDRHGVDIVAWVSAIGGIQARDMTEAPVSRAEVDRTATRCPDPAAAPQMAEAVLKAKADGDSLGGIVTCVCRNVAAGLGEPVFGKMGALLGGAMLTLPAVKGFEIGSGFAGTQMRGSGHNDAFTLKGDRLGTITNRSGGVQGGITNGEPIVFRVAFKPTATIAQPQSTVDFGGQPVVLQARGRHDPCVLPRAVPIVEAMAALVLADAVLIAAARK